MPGLVPGIHVILDAAKTWMAGTSPAMTARMSLRRPGAGDPVYPDAVARASLRLEPDQLDQRRPFRFLAIDDLRVRFRRRRHRLGAFLMQAPLDLLARERRAQLLVQ